MAVVPNPIDPAEQGPNVPEIEVELFGVPRLLARQEAVAARGVTLGGLARSLMQDCPALAGTVLDATSGWPLDGYTFVVDERFTRDAHLRLSADSTVLLVSSVAGG